MVESARASWMGRFLANAATFVVLCASVHCAAQISSSQIFKPDASYPAKTLLRRASEQAAQGQWAESIDLYQKVIALQGDAMAQVPKGDAMADPSESSVLYVDARQHAQARIAALPPEARAIYRSRVDAQAERWYKQGVADHDRGLLKKVVDQAFCSSWGDDAVEALADMGFQDGQFGEALSLYRRVLPDLHGASGVVHPDASVDLARIAAKKLLCRAALGIDPPTPADLKAFADVYADATGPLAGREGPLGRIVAEAISSDHLALPPQSDGRWPTFAGASSRTRIAPGPIDIGQFQWRVRLDPPPAPRAAQATMRTVFPAMNPANPASSDLSPAFHPIVLGDQVIVCDEGRIHAYHLNARPNTQPEGDPAAPGPEDEKVFAWDQKVLGPYTAPQARTQGGGTPRYTLTASGDRIFARLGPSGRGGVAGTIVAVRNNRDIEGKRLWEKSSSEIALPRTRPDAPARFGVFEGSPVADARSVYIGLTESHTEVAAYVACLDAETGATRWVRQLGSAPAFNMMFNMNNVGGGASSAEIGNQLLSLDGQTVYYQTNLGAVAALDAESGAIKWLATYPTRDRPGVNATREPNPAIVHDGLVIVAPDDSPTVLAFDASTGKLLWKTSPMDPRDRIVHLLGVAKGRLIATGDRVYSFDVKDGSLAKTWPDGPSGFEGYGRGLLAGDSIYWPTKADIFVLDQATGAPGDREPIRLAQHYGTGGGNLAVGDGYLIVTQKDWLVVFAQNSRLIDRFRQEIVKDPGNAATYLKLARVAEATGRDELALENLSEAQAHARPSDTIDGVSLIEESRAKQYRLLIRLANAAGAAGDWRKGASSFEAAATVARTDRDRLAARLHLASAKSRAGDPQSAVDTLQSILLDPKLRTQVVAHDERWTVRADLFIADELQSILKESGRGHYSAYDRRAEELLERGRSEKSTRDLEEIGRAYPAAAVSAEALLALGALREADNKPAEAARAYRKLGSAKTTDSMKARALLGLARAELAQGLTFAARDALTRAQGKHADLRLDGPDPATVGSIVAEILSKAPFDTLAGDRTDAVFAVPLLRLWERKWSASVRPLAADGFPPSPAARRVFLAEGTTLRPVDPLTGASPWTVELEAEPTWAGYVGDSVVVGSALRLVALGPGGKVKWRYPEDVSRLVRPVTNPFAPVGLPGVAADRPGSDAPLGRLHDFHVVAGRVFCQRGDREILSLDGETGGVDWTYAPSSGHLNPNALFGPKRVVLQILDPETMVVLESETGRRREFPRSSKDQAEDPAQAWSRPPLVIDDDHICVDIDPRTVASVDLTTGRRAWTSRVTSAALPRNGPPRLARGLGPTPGRLRRQ